MLIKPEAWISENFQAGAAPTATTVRRWLKSGDLDGRKIGGRWFVDSDALDKHPEKFASTGSEAADALVAQALASQR